MNGRRLTLQLTTRRSLRSPPRDQLFLGAQLDRTAPLHSRRISGSTPAVKNSSMSSATVSMQWLPSRPATISKQSPSSTSPRQSPYCHLHAFSSPALPAPVLSSSVSCWPRPTAFPSSSWKKNGSSAWPSVWRTTRRSARKKRKQRHCLSHCSLMTNSPSGRLVGICHRRSPKRREKRRLEMRRRAKSQKRMVWKMNSARRSLSKPCAMYLVAILAPVS
mmetsp:Transcript_60744/g.114699  ORF Transcript_60744/g.114699 Transcript_60744/m.114699 type:complete len:219 (+) Transcript_60744:389-1045(+)